MDHVRGSSLASPAVVEALRPFVLSWWSGRTVEDMPADVRAVHRDAGFRGEHLNLGLVALDSRGRVLRSYVPRVSPPAFGFDPEAQARDFRWQLEDMLFGLAVPAVKPGRPETLTLPDVSCEGRMGGARVYLGFSANRLNHYRTATVEAVKLAHAVRQELRYPESSRTLPLELLKPVLEQIYPPAVMDGHGGFRSISGTLRLIPEPAGAARRSAIVEGTLRFALDNAARTEYEGRLELAVEYGPEGPDPLSFRGVCECVVPKGPEWIRMTALLESRPE